MDKDGDGCTWETIKSAGIAHTGECCLRSRRKSADVVADNWLRLPQLRLDNDKDYLLTFYVTDSFAYQTVDVYLYGDDCYDGNVTPEDLEGDGITEYYSKVLTEDIDVVGSISGWHEVKVDLSDYAGQYVYAAIVQHGGQGEMCVDDIALWQRAAHTPEGDRTNVYFEGFENEDLKTLVLSLLSESREKLLYWPAAFKLHHAIRGGLLYHTLSIVRLAQEACVIYPFVDRELLLSGAILHDIAKLSEFEAQSTGIASGYTTQGTLIGHLVRGAMMVEKKGKELGTDSETLMLLEHMLLSHHGEPEFGAAVRPMFLEAEILSSLDMLDARIYEIQSAIAGTASGEFSARQWALENRKFLNHGRTQSDGNAKLM